MAFAGSGSWGHRPPPLRTEHAAGWKFSPGLFAARVQLNELDMPNTSRNQDLFVHMSTRASYKCYKLF